ncbi:MAG: hypothetical protein A2580_11905 [Hydrogenophilales bacterium RIFOXYD1_FULL_62_11]|nr:MAG: hypothetical protein A2580_11905 [Hydrogenophilales bacterium RIFOXYD1_FULL_62_11]
MSGLSVFLFERIARSVVHQAFMHTGGQSAVGVLQRGGAACAGSGPSGRFVYARRRVHPETNQFPGRQQLA